MKKSATANPHMGVCAICNQEIAKSQITRHLKTCRTSSAPHNGKPADWFHLAIECPYLPEYWIHVAVPGAKTLGDLDQFLRFIWLECCGHCSGFHIGLTRYESHPSDDHFFGRQPDRSLSAKLYDVLEPGLKFTYAYDYGSTTDLKLKVMGVFQAPVDRGESVRLLARNLPPSFTCAECGKPATQLAGGGYGLDLDHCYCTNCAKRLGMEEQEMLMPIVNSPRVGVCAYCG